MINLAPRQVHLDFHTTEQIPGVGQEFDTKAFAKTFKDADVTSVTVFAKCHHGWVYYPSEMYPEMINPSLENKNLLLEQVDALHAEGIKAPVYITVQIDYQAAKNHPEWLIRDKNGSHSGPPFSEPGFWHCLCVNTTYYDYIEKMTDEIMDILGDKLDGLFYDIVSVRPCYCSACRKEMEAQGIDYGNEAEVEKFAKFTLDRFQENLSSHIRERKPDCTIFYNAGHIGPVNRVAKDTFSHYELESLPSGGWGYLHFPASARYARTLGKDCMGMTGKFHTSWGDFHSLKNKAALEFECFKMLSYGFAASVGDQLEPCGRLNPATYELIGSVFSQLKEREEWGRPAKAVVEAAVITTESPQKKGIPDNIFGACQMLEELSVQFDIIEADYDYTPYRLIILPENLNISEENADKLKKYTENGGKVISIGGGGRVNGQYPEFFGVKGANHPDTCNFVLPNDKIAKAMPAGIELVMESASVDLTPIGSTEVLMQSCEPYFYRKGTKFCSHRYTPSARESYNPCVTKNGNVIVFSHRLFDEYHKRAPKWCKEMVRDAVSMLMGDLLISHNGPSTLQASILEQPEKNRYTLHILTYIPVRKCTQFDLIEERTPALDFDVKLNLPKKLKSARLVPENIPINVNDGVIHFDKVCGYSIVELNY